jgi:hypothetical protein
MTELLPIRRGPKTSNAPGSAIAPSTRAISVGEILTADVLPNAERVHERLHAVCKKA